MYFDFLATSSEDFERGQLKAHLRERRDYIRPVVILVFAYVVRPSGRMSVPTFQNLAKQTKFQAKIMFATGVTMDLAD